MAKKTAKPKKRKPGSGLPPDLLRKIKKLAGLA